MRKRVAKKREKNKINSEKISFEIKKIIKIDKEFDPANIPLNLRWEMRDFTFWINLGKKKSQK